MGYAVFSLCFAGVNDFVFKAYGRKKRPVGLLLALAGAVWALVFLALALYRGSTGIDLTTLFAGSLAGIFSAVANILLIEGMKKAGASIGSSIYRLNLVFAAILAFALLGESMGPLKLIGLIIAMAAVVFFSFGSSEGGGQMALRFILILLAASFLRACLGITYKFASIWEVNEALFLALNGIWWTVFGLSYTAMREKGFIFQRSIFGYGLLCGALLCGIVLFLKMAVNVMDASIAVSVSQFSFLVTVPLSALFMAERITMAKGFGLGLAALCIVLFYLAR